MNRLSNRFFFTLPRKNTTDTSWPYVRSNDANWRGPNETQSGGFGARMTIFMGLLGRARRSDAMGVERTAANADPQPFRAPHRPSGLGRFRDKAFTKLMNWRCGAARCSR
jgi:hypothetical protein